MLKYVTIFGLLSLGSLLYSDLSLARTQFGLQLGTITGLTAKQGAFQGTITLGDNMYGHLYYIKRSGSYMYYGVGTILDLGNLLDSKSGILLTKGKKGKGKKGKGGDENGGGFDLGGLFGGSGDGKGGGDGGAFEDLLVRIPVGLQTYFNPVVVFFELGFYVLGGGGSDSALGVRFYF